MHIAVIMDGNGRWALQRGLPRTAGHEAGARAVRRIVETAARTRVDVLTLYAFSSDNWARPRAEVANLMRLFQRFLKSETARCVESGIRIDVIGRRDRLDSGLIRIIDQTEHATAAGNRLILRVAIDYSAREVIVRAANSPHATSADCYLDDAESNLSRFSKSVAAAAHSKLIRADVDLLIRTGGEYRLSDFLLWECAYAELLFTGTYWPDFGELEFRAALAEFDRRDRRYGGLPAEASSTAAFAHE